MGKNVKLQNLNLINELQKKAFLQEKAAMCYRSDTSLLARKELNDTYYEDSLHSKTLGTVIFGCQIDKEKIEHIGYYNTSDKTLNTIINIVSFPASLRTQVIGNECINMLSYTISNNVYNKFTDASDYGANHYKVTCTPIELSSPPENGDYNISSLGNLFFQYQIPFILHKKFYPCQSLSLDKAVKEYCESSAKAYVSNYLRQFDYTVNNSRSYNIITQLQKLSYQRETESMSSQLTSKVKTNLIDRVEFSPNHYNTTMKSNVFGEVKFACQDEIIDYKKIITENLQHPIMRNLNIENLPSLDRYEEHKVTCQPVELVTPPASGEYELSSIGDIRFTYKNNDLDYDNYENFLLAKLAS